MSKIKSSTFSAFQVLAVMIFAVVCCLPFTMVTPKAEAANTTITVILYQGATAFDYGGAYDATKSKIIVQFTNTSGVVAGAVTFTSLSAASETIPLAEGTYIVNIIAPTYMSLSMLVTNNSNDSVEYASTGNSFILNNTGTPVLKIGAEGNTTKFTDDSWLTDFNVANA